MGCAFLVHFITLAFTLQFLFGVVLYQWVEPEPAFPLLLPTAATQLYRQESERGRHHPIALRRVIAAVTSLGAHVEALTDECVRAQQKEVASAKTPGAAGGMCERGELRCLGPRVVCRGGKGVRHCGTCNDVRAMRNAKRRPYADH